MALFPSSPRLSKSGILSVIVEPDVEALDDPQAWMVVLACEGDVPQFFGAGYLHTPNCACASTSIQTALCDVGWLEEFISCVGAFALLEDHPVPLGHAGRIRLMGRMVSERFEGIEGADYDERFEVESVQVQT